MKVKGPSLVPVFVLLLASLLMGFHLFPGSAHAAPLPEVYKAAVDANGGDVAPGDIINYFITMVNLGDTAIADTAGNEFEDPIPANTLYVPLSAQVVQGGGTVAYDLANTRVTWNGSIQPGAANAVVISFSVALSGTLSPGSEVANQGDLHWDADGDGVKESAEPSDDPRTLQVDDDPTRVVVGQSLGNVSAWKTAADPNGGSLLPGEDIRYDLILGNANPAALQARLQDPIPAHTSYVADSAQALDINGEPVGEISYQAATGLLSWNGEMAATSFVFISFRVRVDAGIPGGTAISNQGTLRYDSDGDGSPDKEMVTDDPRTADPDDPTQITVASQTLQTWYLAEGSTDGDMETWLLVQNPGQQAVHVNIVLQTGGGPVAEPDLTNVEIPAASRRSFNLGSFATDYDLSTRVDCLDGEVICERAMYGNGRTWAHDSIGVTSPSATWYLAEGSTGGGMETFVLIQNPGTEAATVNVSFQTDSAEVEPAELQGVGIAAGTRRTFKVNDFVPDSYNVSTRVEATSGEVICERAMYGNGRTWAHDSIGHTR
ncbi:MAG: DUF5719 family protein [Actinomycetota bacterium]|nr:DUF5719 family protein [Actinomycetota bacterium]